MVYIPLKKCITCAVLVSSSNSEYCNRLSESHKGLVMRKTRQEVTSRAVFRVHHIPYKGGYPVRSGDGGPLSRHSVISSLETCGKYSEATNAIALGSETSACVQFVFQLMALHTMLQVTFATGRSYPSITRWSQQNGALLAVHNFSSRKHSA